MESIKSSLEASGPRPEANQNTNSSLYNIAPAIPPPFDSELLAHVQQCVERLEKKKIVIVRTDQDKSKIAFALVNSLGEIGIELFHRICAIGKDYNKESADLFYKEKLERKQIDSSRITIATLFMMFKDAGISIKKKKDPTVNSEKAHAKAFRIIREKYSLTYDSLSQEIYVDGQQLEDSILNTIMIELVVEHDIVIKKDFIQAVIESGFTEKSNRFEDFINRNIDLRPNGAIEKLSNCLITKTGLGLGLSFDYKQTIIKHILVKWIAQQFEKDVPHDLCWVLLGGKHIGKTHFFTHLLPDELSDLCKVSPFKNDKDTKLDATRFLLFVDDELRGRKISDNEFIKSLLSLTSVSIRVPYGRKNSRLKRIAMFCGTGNERFILKDSTGNRRLITFWVDRIDWDLYNSIDKRDLIIEAFHLYKDGYDHRLTSELLDAIDLVSREFEVTSTAEELLIQYLPPAKEETDVTFWWNGHRIRQALKDEHFVSLSDYEIHQALRKLNYQHEYKKVGNSKLLCWLMHRQITNGEGAAPDINTLPQLPLCPF